MSHTVCAPTVKTGKPQNTYKGTTMMDTQKLIEILEEHKRWSKDDRGCRADIRNAYLAGADLKGADLKGAELKGADLTGADLENADLESADLEKANLTGANLRGANLEEANLRGANLKRANLTGAFLTGANLKNITVNWSSHDLLAEILWRAAGGNIIREMLAAFVGRKTEWCWDRRITFDHPEKQWAIDELGKWVKDGDNAPELLKGEIQ